MINVTDFNNDVTIGFAHKKGAEAPCFESSLFVFESTDAVVLSEPLDVGE